MPTHLKIWIVIATSLASLPALAAVAAPEVDASVALQLLVVAGGIAALLKKKGKK
jgi:hypothetical protein